MTENDATLHDVWCFHNDKMIHYKEEWKVFVTSRRLARKQDKDLWRRLRRRAYHNYRRHETFANTIKEVENGL